MGLTPEQYTVIGLLATALLTNVTGQWFTKAVVNQMTAVYEERLRLMTEDRDEYRRLVFELLPINREALDLAEHATKRPR